MQGRDVSVVAEDALHVAAGLVLVLGRRELGLDAVSRMMDAVKLDLAGWLQALHMARREFQIPEAVLLATAIRVLGFVQAEPDCEWDPVSPSDRVIWLKAATHDAALEGGSGERIYQVVGVDSSTPMPLGAIIGTPRMLRSQGAIASAVRELRRVPSSPLGSNSRALGILDSLLLAHRRLRPAGGNQPILNTWSAQGASIARRDVTQLPPHLRRLIDEVKKVSAPLLSEQQEEVRNLAILHAVSLIASCHLLACTTSAAEASGLLASMATVLPEYVETRIAYAASVMTQ
jgi:hypothetical protein